MTAQNFCTRAWLLIGMMRSTPGVLKTDGERLTFVGNEEGCIFDVSLKEVTNVNFPWHYFGGGVKLQIGTVEYRFSFVEPNDYYGAFVIHSSVRDEIIEDLPGRTAGKKWKTILQGQYRLR